jgi:dihydrofolate reductase
MRRVVVSEFVSLDGVVEDPRWTFQFMSEEREDYKFDELSASGALLLGRVTYEGFAAAWPTMMERYEGPRRAELQTYTDMMNGYPKYVVSTTLQEPLEWNNSALVEGDAAEEVLRLKQQPEGYSGLRQRPAREHAAAARPDRRVPADGLPYYSLGQQAAAFRGRERPEGSGAGGDEDARFRRRRPHLPASCGGSGGIDRSHSNDTVAGRHDGGRVTSCRITGRRKPARYTSRANPAF